MLTMSPVATSETLEVTPAQTQDNDASSEALVEDELLVEEISIDGMCGVY